jgi:hypothetical protein
MSRAGSAITGPALLKPADNAARAISPRCKHTTADVPTAYPPTFSVTQVISKWEHGTEVPAGDGSTGDQLRDRQGRRITASGASLTDCCPNPRVVSGHPDHRRVGDPVNLDADRRFCAMSAGSINRQRKSSNAGDVVEKGGRFYAVIYEGRDPITGRERRSWHAAGTDRAKAECVAVSLALAARAKDRPVGLTVARYLRATPADSRRRLRKSGPRWRPPADSEPNRRLARLRSWRRNSRVPKQNTLLRTRASNRAFGTKLPISLHKSG